MSTDETKLIDIVERQAHRIAELEAKVESLMPKEEEPPEVPNKPYAEMTADEKQIYLGAKYAG